MLNFLGKALAGMVLTKEAREAAGDLTDRAVHKAVKKMVGDKLADPLAQPIAEVPVPTAEPVVDRAELIRRAMQVRAAQQAVLADLKPEERAKLTATAMRAFLNESKSKE